MPVAPVVPAVPPEALTDLQCAAAAAIQARLPFTPVTTWSTRWVGGLFHNLPVLHHVVFEAHPWACESLADVLARAGVRALVAPPPAIGRQLFRVFDEPVTIWPNADLWGTGEIAPGLRAPGVPRLAVDLFLADRRMPPFYARTDLYHALRALLRTGDQVVAARAYARRRRLRRPFDAFLRAAADHRPFAPAAAQEIARTDV
jgi:hypothetical protein